MHLHLYCSPQGSRKPCSWWDTACSPCVCGGGRLSSLAVESALTGEELILSVVSFWQ